MTLHGNAIGITDDVDDKLIFELGEGASELISITEEQLDHLGVPTGLDSIVGSLSPKEARDILGY